MYNYGDLLGFNYQGPRHNHHFSNNSQCDIYTLTIEDVEERSFNFKLENAEALPAW